MNKSSIFLFALMQFSLSSSSSSFATTQQLVDTEHRSLIVNGADADPTQFPYFCTLEDYCGGVLIAPDIILTAGHCKGEHMHRVHPHVGAYSYDDYQESFRLQHAFRHPLFDRNDDFEDMVFDFTIIKLQGSSKMPYLAINRNNEFPSEHQDVVVLGLGVLGDDTDERPDVLQQVTLQTMSNAACNASSNGETSYEGRIHETNLCTHTPLKDACDYDSGGPIIATDEHGKEVLVGLVSWGVGCADPDLPAINARVSAVADWIDATVCEISEDPPKDFGCFPELVEDNSRVRLWSLVGGLVCILALFLMYGKRRCQQIYDMVYGDLFDDDDSDENEETEFVDGKTLFPLVKHGSEYTTLTVECCSSDEDSPARRNYRSISP
ncbi:hypothetical protein FisN_23Hh006 [Fistulifera solaris]|uniref:Peptidase S1 domain-containing protein n=1 Tax=Fistulifera solaris TaxID=1519565 RepID=A0A1Z5KN36_FISSO|nr:hypothetical protein FisN_23Hh006 [Fistulifera solaris]|eukprot:GAX27525.1 hypothetical protein FisN_23Hh006 [Fistulifera solaris]